MDRLHARYPFFRAAKAAVERADIDLAEVITEERSPILRRAVERIDGAIEDGRVPDPTPDARVELLSYPVARVLVSLIDNPVLTERYALAEARRAFDLLSEEFDPGPNLRSTDIDRLTLSEVLEEFDLEDRIDAQTEGYDIHVTAYLLLTTELKGANWRLVNRALADGTVPVSRGELEALLQEAIRLRVADGLPLDVPEPIADGLEREVSRIQASLADVHIPTDVDVVDPEAFPPCMAALYDRARAGQSLTTVERFTLVSFLCSIGASAADVIEMFAPETPSEEQGFTYQVEHVHGATRSTAYPPPSCEVLGDYGICDGESCRETGHPVATYARNLETPVPE